MIYTASGTSNISVSCTFWLYLQEVNREVPAGQGQPSETRVFLSEFASSRDSPEKCACFLEIERAQTQEQSRYRARQGGEREVYCLMMRFCFTLSYRDQGSIASINLALDDGCQIRKNGTTLHSVAFKLDLHTRITPVQGPPPPSHCLPPRGCRREDARHPPSQT